MKFKMKLIMSILSSVMLYSVTAFATESASDDPQVVYKCGGPALPYIFPDILKTRLEVSKDQLGNLSFTFLHKSRFYSSEDISILAEGTMVKGLGDILLSGTVTDFSVEWNSDNEIVTKLELRRDGRLTFESKLSDGHVKVRETGVSCWGKVKNH